MCSIFQPGYDPQTQEQTFSACQLVHFLLDYLAEGRITDMLDIVINGSHGSLSFNQKANSSAEYCYRNNALFCFPPSESSSRSCSSSG